MRVFAKLTLLEIKLLLREPVGAFFTLIFPTLLVVILGFVPSFREPQAELGGLRVVDVYVGICVVLTLAMLAFQVTPAVLAGYREKGILRRAATTPLHPLALLGAQLTMNMLVAVVSAGLAVTVGRLAFDVPLAGNFPGFLLAFLLGAAAVLAIGLVIAALAPTAKFAGGLGTLLFFPSMFFAGLWAPREVMPAIIQRIGDFTPLGAAERAVHEAMTGSWPNLLSVTVLAAYVAGFGFAAVRLFRWS